MFTTRRTVLAGLALGPTAAHAQSGGTALSFDVAVPFDHASPRDGAFGLRCEWGAAPRADVPTVIAVADAQQFFVRPGGAARLQAQIFGPAFNVLTIVGRGRSAELQGRLETSAGFDIGQAARLLEWTQWVGDMAAVIRSLGLPRDRLAFYGRSGGAHLIHQFLTLHSSMVGRAYVQAAVNHDLDVAWGLGADRFWEELNETDAAAARDLLAFVRAHPDHRKAAVLVLQRQHFFERLDALPAARVRAIQAFTTGNQALIDEMTARYQIDALAAVSTSLEGLAAARRVAEFARPHPDPRANPDRVSPDIEALFHYGEPFTALPGDAGAEGETADFSRLRTQQAEVLQVAGRRDHTCDYRTQIGLSGMTDGSRLIILDDNHVFERWTASGRQPDLIRSFLADGLAAPATRRALHDLQDLVWREA